MKAFTSTQMIKEAAPMPGKINSIFDGVAENSQEWTWTLFQVLSAAMFMTHGYGKLFGENPQPTMGGWHDIDQYRRSYFLADSNGG
jgi:hypothetical protein